MDDTTHVATSPAMVSALEEGERLIAQPVHADGGVGVILGERITVSYA
jgi:hypothetical protein